MTFDAIMAVYKGSDAEATKALYARLLTFAPRGVVAVNLMRTCKASERAKVYRGGARGRGSYRSMAYEKKDWSIGELCCALRDNPDVAQSWGWGFDKKAIGFEHVLYVDLPGVGQVSFHTEHRRDGPDYAGTWDGARGTAPTRICMWVEAVLDGREATNQGEKDVARQDRDQGDAAAGLGKEQAGPPEPVQQALDL